jgi:radical SAM protein with 4Fe4S-binding SPASM domain
MEQQPDISLSTDKTGVIGLIRAAGLHPPESMTLMVTDGCNLQCRHCWLDCQPLGAATVVSARKIEALIDDFVQLGGTRISLTGGEFLSHPQWHAILEFCCSHPRITSVCLQSNATLITHRHLEAIQGLQQQKLTIQVSLDGARAHTHNIVRGPGSYARTMVALRLLVNAGLGLQTHVAFTEMAHNFHELPQLLDIVDQMGIGRLTGSTLIRGGRAAASAHISLPTPNQYWELIDLYQTDTHFRTLYDQKATIAAIEWFKHRSESADNKCACLKNIFVDARGILYPCTMLLLDRFASQSVYSQPLEQVIRESLAQWREIPLLNRRRKKMLPKCNHCRGKNHCGGGCMGRSATWRGELMDPEDRCSLRKAVYHWTMLPGAGSFYRKG